MHLLGLPLTGSTFASLTANIASVIRCHQSTLITSLSKFVGNKLTAEELSLIAGFCASMEDQLRKGEAVFPPSSGGDPGWNVIEVVDLQTTTSGLEFVCKVIYGNAYGANVSKVVQMDGPALHSMYRKAGITGRRRKQAFPRDLVGMLFLVNLTATDKNVAGLTFWNIEQPTVLDSRNRKLTSERRKPCPIGKTHPCAFCGIGKAECPRAVRPVTISLERKELNATV